MPQGYYNNDKPITNVYTPMMFSNPNSRIQATRLSISYFNRMMCIKIAEKIPGNPGDIPKWNNDSSIGIYLSARQAKLLHDAIKDMLETGKNNVNIETRKGMIQVSNGAEYGSDTPCVVIFYNSDNNGTGKAIYQMVGDDTVAYNFTEGNYSSMKFKNYEMETFLMVLEEYWRASSYAHVAAFRESMAYSEKTNKDVIFAIASKVGARVAGNQQGNAQSFLSNNQSNFNSGSGSSEFNGAPQGYDQSSFDDIVNSMGSYAD